MKTLLLKKLIALTLLLLAGVGMLTKAQDTLPPDKLVYKINIKEDIMPAAWRSVKVGFEEAKNLMPT